MLQTWGRVAGELPYGVDWQPAEHESAVYSERQEGQQHPGSYLYSQQEQGADHATTCGTEVLFSLRPFSTRTLSCFSLSKKDLAGKGLKHKSCEECLRKL